MAGGAGAVNQGLIVQGRGPGVADIGLPLGIHRLAHVAVGAGVVARVLAAGAHEGLEFRVLDLDLAHAGAGICVVREGLALHRGVVVVSQDRVGRHGLQAGIGQGRSLGGGIEIIFHMALCAGEIFRVHLHQVPAHGIGDVGMGHHQLAGGVGMAVVAADGFADLGLHILKGDSVGGISQFVDLGGKVRGLAAEAVGQGVGASGGGHVLNGVDMPSGTGIVFVEGHTLIDLGQHGVIRHIVMDLPVFRVGEIRGVDVRVLSCPFCGGSHLDGGAGLHNLGGSGRRSGNRDRTRWGGGGVLQICTDQVRGVDDRCGGDGSSRNGVHILSRLGGELQPDELVGEIRFFRLGADAVGLREGGGADDDAHDLPLQVNAGDHVHHALGAADSGLAHVIDDLSALEGRVGVVHATALHQLHGLEFVRVWEQQ